MSPTQRIFTRHLARLTKLHSHKLLERSVLAMVVKDVFLLDGRPSVCDAAPPTILEERVTDSDDFLVAENDLVASNKLRTDVLVFGSAHAGAAVSSLDTSLQVAGVRKEVRVHGDRAIRARGGQLTFEPATPFESAPLSKRNAYGGELAVPRPRGAFGARMRNGQDHDRPFYPRNRFGRGFSTYDTADALDGCLAPSQESPLDPITPARLALATIDDWSRAPIAADYGPIDLFEFPRCQFAPVLGVEARSPLAEVDHGLIDPEWLAQPYPEGIERVAQCAPPGQIGELRGGEPLFAENLFPGGGAVELVVPHGPNRAALDLPGAGRWTIPLGLKTLVLKPDEGRLELVWAGRMDVALVYQPHDLEEIHVASLA